MKNIIRILILIFAVAVLARGPEVVMIAHGVVPAVPTFAPDGPYSGGATSVTISTTSGTAKYCTGASDCDPSSGTTYSTPVSISSTIHLCAQSTKTGFPASATHCGTYTIGAATPAIVQSKACQDWSGYSTSWTCSFNSPTTAGNAVISFSLFGNSATLSSIGDTHNTYQQDFTAYFFGNQHLYFNSTANAASMQTITYNISSSQHYQAVIVEVSGLASTGPLVDKTHSYDNGYNGGLTFTSQNTATTAQATEFMLGWCENTYPNVYTFTDDSPWSLVAQEPIGGSRIAWRTATSTGAYAYSGSFSGGSGEYWVAAAIVTYKSQ